MHANELFPWDVAGFPIVMCSLILLENGTPPFFVGVCRYEGDLNYSRRQFQRSYPCRHMPLCSSLESNVCPFSRSGLERGL